MRWCGLCGILKNIENERKAAENQGEIIAAKDARIAELEALVKYYEEQFRLAKHRQFGVSSEKSEYDQISLFNEAEVCADANVPEPELVEIQRHYRKSRRLVHDRLPENLPIEIVEHDLPFDEQICPECGGPLHVMGREKRRELVIVPVYDALHEILCTHDVLHADETTLLLHEPEKTPQSKSYMWLYRTSEYRNSRIRCGMPIVLYDYQPDRKTIRPAEFLKGFQGYLHTDGYDAYHGLEG